MHDIFIIIPTILMLAKIIGEVFDRFEMPSVLGEILIGIVLGPEVLKILDPENEFISILCSGGGDLRWGRSSFYSR